MNLPEREERALQRFNFCFVFSGLVYRLEDFGAF
jgi:hypothetical protein